MSARTTVKSIQDIMRKDSGVDGDAQRIGQLCWMFFLKIMDDQDQELELLRDDYVSPVPPEFQWRSWAADPEGVTGEGLLNFVNAELFPQLKKLSIEGDTAARRRVVRSVFEDAYNYMKSGQLIRQVINKINDIDFNDLSQRTHFGEIYEQILNDLQSAGNAGEYYTPRAVTAFMVDRIDPKPGETLFDPACGTGGFLTCAMRHMRENYVKRPEQEAAMHGALRAVEKKPLPHMLCTTNMLLHGIEDPSFVRRNNTLARPYISWERKDRVDIVLTNPPFGGKEEDGIENNFPAPFKTKETADLFLVLIIRLLKKGGRAAVVLPDGTMFGDGIKRTLKEHLMKECNLHTIVRLPNSVFKPYAFIGTNLLFFEKGKPTKDIWFYEHRVAEGQKPYSIAKSIKFEYFQDCIDWWGGPKREGREETELAWKASIDEVRERDFNLDFKNPNTVEAELEDPDVLLARLYEAEAETAASQSKLKTILAETPRPDPSMWRRCDLARQVENHIGGGSSTMNQEQFLAIFEKVKGETEVSTHLMRSILAMATKGLLVSNSTDGSSMPSNRQEGDLAYVPYKLPASWRWVRLDDVCEYDAGDKIEPAALDPSAWLLELEDLEKETGRLLHKASVGDRKPKSMKSAFRVGDVLYGKLRPYLTKVLVAGENGYSTSEIIALRPKEAITSHFLAFCLRRHDFIDYVTKIGMGTKMPRLRTGDGKSAPIPLPPLEEQKRIVAKVDELMALYDEIEASLENEATTKASMLKLLVAYRGETKTITQTALSH